MIAPATGSKSPDERDVSAVYQRSQPSALDGVLQFAVIVSAWANWGRPRGRAGRLSAAAAARARRSSRPPSPAGAGRRRRRRALSTRNRRCRRLGNSDVTLRNATSGASGSAAGRRRMSCASRRRGGRPPGPCGLRRRRRRSPGHRLPAQAAQDPRPVSPYRGRGRGGARRRRALRRGVGADGAGSGAGVGCVGAGSGLGWPRATGAVASAAAVRAVRAPIGAL